MGTKSLLRSAKRVLWVTIGVSMVGLVALPSVSQAAHKTKPTLYYVSLGDSYSIGYQPTLGTGTPGYTAYVAKKKHMTLENFGCAGATTTSILTDIGCGLLAATDAVPYPTETQADAAEAFVLAHPGQIGLITVSIGGNDVTSCASEPTTAAIEACIGAADATITANVGSLVGALRTDAGAGVPIVGLTYPDVALGAWVYPPGMTDQSLASVSVTAFSLLINPTLQAAYATVGGHFADVTAATGAYKPFSHLVHSPYGKIPFPVAQVCKLTWYCQLGDIHANTKGYTLEGKLITHTF
jgi:lysophospholipase L1-like esterase